jgi:hypothetical protein
MAGSSRSTVGTKKKKKVVKRMVRRKVAPAPKAARNPSPVVTSQEMSQEFSSQDDDKPDFEHQELLHQLLSKMKDSGKGKLKKRVAKLKLKAKEEVTKTLHDLGNAAMSSNKRSQMSLVAQLKASEKGLKEQAHGLEREKEKQATLSAKKKRQIAASLENLQTLRLEKEKKEAYWEKMGRALDFTDISKLSSKHDRAVGKICNSDVIKHQLLDYIGNIF